MMNTQISKENWPALKMEIQKTWEDISADELELTHGSIKSIYGLVAQKCGLHEEEVKFRLTSLLKKYDSPLKRKFNR
ncbi:CsbD family protein [Bdellovibrio sp. BCCA]|uniref:CsbD family protein n=1 Tax=unclassified Bdellovibrio TaxID=2633795 RepID=UPI0025CD35B0|nr:CsbD family protein [uncultured Bdellovibrio sp.]